MALICKLRFTFVTKQETANGSVSEKVEKIVSIKQLDMMSVWRVVQILPSLLTIVEFN